MSGSRVYYLDSSAIVKLALEEPESVALRRHLAGTKTRVSSALAQVEVVRALASCGPVEAERGRAILREIDIVRIGGDVLSRAATLGPPGLRSLDAIHLATALLFGDELRHIVTYDARLAAAARAAGLRVTAPA